MSAHNGFIKCLFCIGTEGKVKISCTSKNILIFYAQDFRRSTGEWREWEEWSRRYRKTSDGGTKLENGLLLHLSLVVR